MVGEIMGKKKRKRLTAKMTGRMVVIFFLFGTVIFTLGYRLVVNLKAVSDFNQELDALKVQKEVLLDEEDAIEADIKRLSDQMYIARYAREKYLYSREGELILRIEE